LRGQVDHLAGQSRLSASAPATASPSFCPTVLLPASCSSPSLPARQPLRSTRPTGKTVPLLPGGSRAKALVTLPDDAPAAHAPRRRAPPLALAGEPGATPHL
jgi:hypothetical protein